MGAGRAARERDEANLHQHVAVEGPARGIAAPQLELLVVGRRPDRDDEAAAGRELREQRPRDGGGRGRDDSSGTISMVRTVEPGGSSSQRMAVWYPLPVPTSRTRS